jgi:hypothetical protein
MKKLLVIISLIVLTAAACNKTTTNNSNTLPPSPQPSSDTQVYTNATYGFEFTYPKTMKFITPTYASLQDKIVEIQITKDEYSGTNFGDGAFSVSAQYAKSLMECLNLTPPENGDGFKTKITINGVDFYMTKSAGAGAGNFYESNVYRTVRSPGGACIEIMETIHTTNIGNYPEGTVTEVNKAEIQQKLDQILNSFSFSQ